MKITNIYGFPEPLVRACAAFTQKPVASPIRVTSLIDSPRILALKLKHWDDLEEDVSDRIWAIFGSAVHQLLEGHAIEELSEASLKVAYDGTEISGTSDLYHEGMVSDWKVTSVWSIIYGQESWEPQLNVYAQLFEDSGKPVTSLQVIAILRDWQRSKAEQDTSYPQKPVVAVPIRLWKAEERLAYIKRRIELHTQGEAYICDEKDRWTKQTIYAVYKGENKRATKLFDSMDDAFPFSASIKDSRIEERKGEDSRCLNYCPVRDFCDIKKV